MTPEQIEGRRAAALEAVALRRSARAAESRAAPDLLRRAAPKALSEQGVARLLEAPRFRMRLGARLARMAGAGSPPWTASAGALAVLEMDPARIEGLRRDAGAALEASAVLSLLKAEEQKRLVAALGRDPAPAARRYGLDDSEDGPNFAWPDPDEPLARQTPEEIAEDVVFAGAQAFAAWLRTQPKSITARVGMLSPEATLETPSEDSDLARRGADLVERIAADARRQGPARR